MLLHTVKTSETSVKTFSLKYTSFNILVKMFLHLYPIDQARKLWLAVENTLMNCSETISLREYGNACSVSGGVTMRGRGGTNHGCRRWSGGPILAGDHRRRDRFSSMGRRFCQNQSKRQI